MMLRMIFGSWCFINGSKGGDNEWLVTERLKELLHRNVKKIIIQGMKKALDKLMVVFLIFFERGVSIKTDCCYRFIFGYYGVVWHL